MRHGEPRPCGRGGRFDELLAGAVRQARHRGDRLLDREPGDNRRDRIDRIHLVTKIGEIVDRIHLVGAVFRCVGNDVGHLADEPRAGDRQHRSKFADERCRGLGRLLDRVPYVTEKLVRIVRHQRFGNRVVEIVGRIVGIGEIVGRIERVGEVVAQIAQITKISEVAQIAEISQIAEVGQIVGTRIGRAFGLGQVFHQIVVEPVGHGHGRSPRLAKALLRRLSGRG
jgi:hypothetical protein